MSDALYYAELERLVDGHALTERSVLACGYRRWWDASGAGLMTGDRSECGHDVAVFDEKSMSGFVGFRYV